MQANTSIHDEFHRFAGLRRKKTTVPLHSLGLLHKHVAFYSCKASTRFDCDVVSDVVQLVKHFLQGDMRAAEGHFCDTRAACTLPLYTLGKTYNEVQPA